MSKHVTISPSEVADRLAIRELVEAYAHCADRRDATGQMALFTADTHFVVYMNAKDPRPSQELHSRDALVPVFADLNQYDATTHFVGQSTIFTLTGDRAKGEAYCLAHSRYGQWKATLDGRLAPLPRHVRKDRRGVALCRAAARRRLAGGASTVMNVSFLSRPHRKSRSSRRRECGLIIMQAVVEKFAALLNFFEEAKILSEGVLNEIPLYNRELIKRFRKPENS